jgi:transcriptional regulator of acetoin/glycerol metabolism
VQSISRPALNYLCTYRWPGNVRELSHIIERVILLGDGKRIDLADLPPDLIESVESNAAAIRNSRSGTNDVSGLKTLDTILKGAIEHSLAQARGDLACPQVTHVYE